MKKLVLFIASFFVISFVSAQDFIRKIGTGKEQANKFYNYLKKGDLAAFRFANNPAGLMHLEYDAVNTAYDTISRIIYGDYDDGVSTLNINQAYKKGIYLNKEKYKIFAKIDSAVQLYEIDSVHVHTWDTVTNVWELSIRILFAYKSPGNISTITTYLNIPLFGWTKWVETKYYYDGNNFAIASINFTATFSGLNFVMVPSDSAAFTNDVKGNPTTEILWNYNNSAYVYSSKYLRIFDANDNTTVETHQRWDTTGGGGVWENNSLDSLTYDANGNETMDIQYIWNGSVWSSLAKYTTSYNSKQQIAVEMSYVLNGAAWRASYRKTYNFKGNGDRDFDLVERSADGTTWVVEHGDDKDIYLYDITLELNQSHINTDALSIFPNPSHGRIMLNFGSNVNGKPVVITVYDITGKPVCNDIVSIIGSKTDLNLSTLNTGMYLLKVTNGNNTSVKRIIIAK